MGSTASTVYLENLNKEDIGNYASKLIRTTSGQDTKFILISNSIDGKRLDNIGGADKVASLLKSIGITNPLHRRQLRDGFIDLQRKLKCSHKYLDDWDGEYHCVDCHKPVNSNARVVSEREFQPFDDTLDSSSGERSSRRGVTIQWLVEWTNTMDCWNLSTRTVRRYFIIPATSKRRCRYVDLPKVVECGTVGPADTYVSHSWDAPWGDLVAALMDGGANHNRRVWIDIFAVRQWPCRYPDREFAATIRACPSFMFVCSAPPEAVELDEKEYMKRCPNILLETVKTQIAFFRLWCLLELRVAIDMIVLDGKAVVIKAGKHDFHKRDKTVFYQPYEEIVRKVFYLIDVKTALLTVEIDRKRIFEQATSSEEGVDTLSTDVRQLIARVVRHECMSEATLINAACGDEDALEYLLSDTSAICRVSIGGYHTLLTALLNRGADVSVTDKKGRTALMLAAMCGHLRCVGTLICAGSNIDAEDEDGITAVMFAAEGGHVECVEALITKGADISKERGTTALVLAVMGHHIDCIKTLLIHGADKEFHKDQGVSLLMWAASGGHIHILNSQLAAGDDVNGKEVFGRTPLIYAAINGRTKCIYQLLESGADVHAKEVFGKTALMWSAINGHVECIKLLLKAGSNPSALDRCGKTALDYAKQYKHSDCAKLLSQLLSTMKPVVEKS